MAMRKAVLSNSLGVEGIPRIRANRDAVIADGVDGYANAACNLLQDRNLRKSIAASGYELVKREYAWEALAGRFDEVYRELTVGRRELAVRG